MEKKILIINGSNRKKNTYGLLTQIGEILKRYGASCEFINLHDYDINHCRGCDTGCIFNPNCNNNRDDMEQLRGKFTESDGVVIGTPVYINGVSSVLKAFIDRTNCWVHNPEPAGIPVLSVAATASTGLKETEAFMKKFAMGIGCRIGGFVSRNNATMKMPVAEAEIKNFLSLLEKDKSEYKPGISEIISFQVGKVLASKFQGSNEEYWSQRGWLDGKKFFYYDCKIGFFKKRFAKFLNKILVKKIQIE